MKLFLVLMVFLPFFAMAEKRVTLVTMDIPPFMSASLPEQGAAVYGLRKIFEKIGYKLEMRFIPIQRTRGMGLEDPLVHGFFPSFKDDDFVPNTTLSKTVYRTPWVIVERKDKPIVWKKAKDLLKYKGGNVGGYTLRSEVASIYRGKPNLLEIAPDDVSNIHMVAQKRVDFIFIDKHVFEFILATDPDCRSYANILQINPKIVALNKYGIAFKKKQASREIMEKFNKVATEKEFTERAEEYIKKYMPKK